MRVRIQPYKAGSRSAKELSRALGVRRLRQENSRFRVRPADKIINWGSTQYRFPDIYYINDPLKVERACNKAVFLSDLALWNEEGGFQICHPPFTTNPDEAREKVEEGCTIIARTMLRASGGRGIHVLNRDTEFVQAPLYTQYLKKRDEYRVHVLEDNVIHVQQKRRRREEKNVNNHIRNHENGWVFTIHDVDPPQPVLNQALLAIEASGLDFGAVDVIWNDFYQKATVLEINTAPGLEGTTLDKYTEAFTRLLNL